LVAKGERRWRHYVASEGLEKLRAKAQIPPTKIDPFAQLQAEYEAKQQSLPAVSPG
jgi:hypothetical protein